MQVLVRTDNHIAAHEQHLILFAEEEVRRELVRFTDRLSRVDVHLAEESGRPDAAGRKRCTLEARPLRGQPVSVVAGGATVGDALSDALRKLADLLDGRFARRREHKGAATIRR